MAYTTAQSTAQMITELQTVNPLLNNDAILTVLSGLAAGNPVAVGSPVLFSTVLIKCTTGYPSTPVYAYDAAPA